MDLQGAYPRLIYAADLPPCHLNGGPILMHRLLSGYPMDRLTIACNSALLPRAAATMLPCRHVPLFGTTGTGRWGVGRVRQLIDLSAMGPNVFALERLLRETQAEAVLTVAHGTMFIAAVLAASRARKPSVVVVHDDWTWFIGHHTWVPRRAAPPILGRTLRRATHVYAISDGVQQWLQKDFGIDSEVQLPCADSAVFSAPADRADGIFRIVFTGAFVECTAAGLGLMVEALRQGAIGENWTLDLYGPSAAAVAQLGWNDPRVTAHGWQSQQEVHKAMSQADLLYVPFAFDEESQRLGRRQFPSKLADYLAARRPVLVSAPAEIAVSRYVRRSECAELVEENSVDAIEAALRRLASSPQRRQQLVDRGWKAFQTNHEVGRLRSELLYRLRTLCGSEAGACELATPAREETPVGWKE
jgi:glycosyltransferase involved in cell wall biosynthesis